MWVYQGMPTPACQCTRVYLHQHVSAVESAYTSMWVYQSLPTPAGECTRVCLHQQVSAVESAYTSRQVATNNKMLRIERSHKRPNNVYLLWALFSALRHTLIIASWSHICCIINAFLYVCTHTHTHRLYLTTSAIKNKTVMHNIPQFLTFFLPFCLFLIKYFLFIFCIFFPSLSPAVVDCRGFELQQLSLRLSKKPRSSSSQTPEGAVWWHRTAWWGRVKVQRRAVCQKKKGPSLFYYFKSMNLPLCFFSVIKKSSLNKKYKIHHQSHCKGSPADLGQMGSLVKLVAPPICRGPRVQPRAEVSSSCRFPGDVVCCSGGPCCWWMRSALPGRLCLGDETACFQSWPSY